MNCRECRKRHLHSVRHRRKKRLSSTGRGVPSGIVRVGLWLRYTVTLACYRREFSRLSLILEFPCLRCYWPGLAMSSYFCFAFSNIATTDCFSASVFHAALPCAAEISRSIQARKYAASGALRSGALATFT